MQALALRAASPRLNEWWPATVIGLAAALLLGGQDGNAQSLSLQGAEANRVAQGMAQNDPNWRHDLRRYVERSGDRRTMVERTRGVLAAYRDRCEDSCSTDTVRQALQTASGAACAAGIVPASIDPAWVPPRGTLGFDFQPVGARTANGFRPVVPGDPRLTGGERPLAQGNKEDFSTDSLLGVRRFVTRPVQNGEYRVIVLGAAGEAGRPGTFGGQVTINGRPIEIASAGLADAVARLGDQVRNVRVMGSVQAPMLVFDLSINTSELDLQFATGGTVSGLIVEPIGSSSVLDGAVAAKAVTSVEQCMASSTDIQIAAGDVIQDRRNRVLSVMTASGSNGGDNVGGTTLTSGSAGGGGGGGGSGGSKLNNASPLSGN